MAAINIYPDMKRTFGNLHYLGFKDKYVYEEGAGRKDPKDRVVESKIIRASSSVLGMQVEVTVPPHVMLGSFIFNDIVEFPNAYCAPYGKTQADSTYAEVVMKLVADNVFKAGQPGQQTIPSAAKKE